MSGQAGIQAGDSSWSSVTATQSRARSPPFQPPQGGILEAGNSRTREQSQKEEPSTTMHLLCSRENWGPERGVAPLGRSLRQQGNLWSRKRGLLRFSTNQLGPNQYQLDPHNLFLPTKGSDFSAWREFFPKVSCSGANPGPSSGLSLLHLGQRL